MSGTLPCPQWEKTREEGVQRDNSAMGTIMRLEMGAQRWTGVGSGGLGPAALDALRPREAGLGAAQPGQPLVSSAPQVLVGGEAHGRAVCGPWTCLRGWARPGQMVSFHLPLLSLSKRPGSLMTAQSPDWTCSQEHGHGGAFSLSLSPPPLLGNFLWEALALPSDSGP